MALKTLNKSKVVRKYVRAVITGIPGIGKTTAFATIAKKALVLDLEKRWPKELVQKHDFLDFTETYSGVKEALNSILVEPKLEHDWLILDSGTALMKLIKQHSINSDFRGEANNYADYAKGEKMFAPTYINELLGLLDKIGDKFGVNLGLVCHTTTKPQANIFGKDWQKQCLDLPERVASSVMQWCDACGFAYFDVEVRQDGLKSKARGQHRVISFNDNPAYEAKSGLPYPLPEKVLFDKEGKWADLVFGTRPLVNELEMLLDKYPEDKVEAVRANLEKMNFRALPDDQLKGLVGEMTKYVNNGFKEAK